MAVRCAIADVVVVAVHITFATGAVGVIVLGFALTLSPPRGGHRRFAKMSEALTRRDGDGTGSFALLPSQSRSK